MEKLASASVEEAEAASAVAQGDVQSESGTCEETSGADERLQTAETAVDGSDTEAGVRLYTRAVSIFST